MSSNQSPGRRILLGATAALAMTLLVSCGDDGGGQGPRDQTPPTIEITSHTTAVADTAGSITLAGTASDDSGVPNISWSSSTGAAGTALSGPGNPPLSRDQTTWELQIPLDDGDQTLTITATDGADNTASAQLFVTRNRYLLLTSAPSISPSGALANVATQITARVALDPFSTLRGGGHTLRELALDEVNDAGSPVRTIGTLTDDGNLANGDEIQGDGLWSHRSVTTFDSAGDARLRFRATYSVAGGSDETDHSAIFTFPIVDGVPAETVQAVAQAASDGWGLAQSLIVGGSDIPTAAAETAVFLQGLPPVATAAVSEDGFTVWFEATSGIRGNVLLNPSGTRGGEGRGPRAGAALSERGGPLVTGPPPSFPPSGLRADGVGSNSVVVYDPFLSEITPNDEGPYLRSLFESSSCPVFNVDYFADFQCTVGVVGTFDRYGTIILVTHGGLHDGQAFFTTRDVVRDVTIQDHLIELTLGNLTVTAFAGEVYFSVLPAYVSSRGLFPESIVYAGTCNGFRNDTLADAFLQNGASVYLGFDRVVSSSFANTVARDFFDSMVLDRKTTGEAFVAGQADPASPFAEFRGRTISETEYATDLTNAGFETGTLQGWTEAGDGRVITALGDASPTQGAFMAIISTGLGFTTSSGAIRTSICPPPVRAGGATMTFDWNFFSEEFLIWCDSIYQDFFQIEASVDGGAPTILFFENIDSLCPTVTLTDLHFDQGDAGEVYSSGWRTTSVGLPPVGPGQSLVITFSAGDIGDSIFDTAILIDDIRIQ